MLWCTLALWSLSLPASPQANAQQTHLGVAQTYVGTQELGNNAGPEVERFLAAVGLRKGNPYCAAFVSFTLDEAIPIADLPTVRSALASKFITRTSIKASDVLRGTAIEPGTLLIWKKGNTIFGHIGIVLEWDGACGTTIEANTSSGTYGSQRDGDGVWIRKRCIEPGNYFRIVSFTPVVYPLPASEPVATTPTKQVCASLCEGIPCRCDL